MVLGNWRSILRIFFLFFLALASLHAKLQDTVIIGGGPGALSCALYLSRANLEAYVLEGGSPGGLITQSHMVENWPGEMGIQGRKLAEKMREQVLKNGGILRKAEAVSVDFTKKPYKITAKDLTTDQLFDIYANQVVIAMGTTPNFLGIPGEKTYFGRGVSNCAICDGRFFSGKAVAIIGGGDSAILEAEYLANICKEVHIFVRKPKFKSNEHQRKEQVLAKKNVFVHYGSTVKAILGNESSVEKITVLEKGQKTSYPVKGVFLAIGSTPNTKMFQGQLDLKKGGYIALEKGQKTTKSGIYAIGDIVDPFYKQAISAAADGAKAAIEIQQTTKKAAYKIIENEEEWQQLLNDPSKVVIADFYAPWCGPCQRVDPVFQKIGKKLQGPYVFVKVNLDLLPSLGEDYDISSIPQLIVLKKGKILARKLGPKQVIEYLQNMEFRE